MRNLWLKYKFWRRIKIHDPLYLDEAGRRIDGPPLNFLQRAVIRVQLWFGIRWVDDA